MLKRTYDAEYTTKIQLRVGVAIQQWIKSPFFDFSDEILQTLEDFSQTMILDGHNKLGETLLQDLKKKIDEANKSHKHLMFTVPPQLNVRQFSLSFIFLKTKKIKQNNQILLISCLKNI